jgi:hypothetical protein
VSQSQIDSIILGPCFIARRVACDPKLARFPHRPERFDARLKNSPDGDTSRIYSSISLAQPVSQTQIRFYHITFDLSSNHQPSPLPPWPEFSAWSVISHLT